MSAALIERYGRWACGWRWATAEGDIGGGPVGAWCCPRDSMSTPDATLGVVAAAPVEWRSWLEDLNERFARFLPLPSGAAEDVVLDIFRTAEVARASCQARPNWRRGATADPDAGRGSRPMRARRNHLTVAYRGDTLVGCSTIRPPEDDRATATVIVRVLPEHRRQGFGGQMYDKALTAAYEIGARVIETIVLASNEDGLRFAERHGFVEIDRYVLEGDTVPFIDLRLADAAE